MLHMLILQSVMLNKFTVLFSAEFRAQHWKIHLVLKLSFDACENSTCEYCTFLIRVFKSLFHNSSPCLLVCVWFVVCLCFIPLSTLYNLFVFFLVWKVCSNSSLKSHELRFIINHFWVFFFWVSQACCAFYNWCPTGEGSTLVSII